MVRQAFDTNSSSTGEYSNSVEVTLKALHALLNDMLKRQRDLEELKSKALAMDSEWRNLALTLDRLFFVIYLVVIIISLTLLFPKH